MAEITDTDRLNFIADALHAMKWNDSLPMFRPRDIYGDNTEKYVKASTFRAAIDYCMLHGVNTNW